MRRLPSLFLFIMAALFLSSCGGGSSSNKNPKNAEDAIKQISPEHRKNFQAWQSKVVKSCSANEAFGISSSDQGDKGVDGKALLKMNKGSMTFIDGTHIALLTDVESMSGYGETSSEQENTFNGKGYKISASTKREGSRCIVYLYGKEVYRTTILASVSIGASWLKGTQADVESTPQFTEIAGDSDPMLLVGNSGVFPLVEKLFKPTKESRDFVAQRLGMEGDEGAKLIRVQPNLQADFSLRLADKTNSPWTSGRDGNLIGAKADLQGAMLGSGETVNLEVRAGVPQFNFSDEKNDADLLTGQATVGFKTEKNDAKIKLTASEVVFKGGVKYDSAEALACVEDRTRLYLPTSSENHLRPNVDLALAPCHLLHNKLQDLVFSEGLMKKLVSKVFANVVPSRTFDFGGWHQILSKLSREALDAGKNIREELDPEHKSALVEILSQRLDQLKVDLEAYPQMKPLTEEVYQMGTLWSFSGADVSVADAHIMIEKLANVVDPFEASVRNTLSYLANDPNGGSEQLARAVLIDDEFKTVAVEAKKAADQLNYSEYNFSVFNVVLQKQISISEVETWRDDLRKLVSVTQAYTGLGEVKGRAVGAAMVWLRANQVDDAQLKTFFAALNNANSAFPKSTDKFVRSLATSYTEAEPTIQFAQGINAEYKKLAAGIIAAADKADFKDWSEEFASNILQNKPTLADLKAISSTWTAAAGFIQRDKKRAGNGFGGSGNEDKVRDLVERALEEKWVAANVTALEALAPIAKFSNTCEHYTGYASLIDCVGDDKVSNKAKSFFDPSFGARYTTLAQEMKSHLNALKDQEFFSLRWELVDSFFDEPLWSDCSNNEFKTRSAKLKTDVTKLSRTSDQLQKWELERSIKESLENCN